MSAEPTPLPPHLTLRTSDYGVTDLPLIPAISWSGVHAGDVSISGPSASPACLWLRAESFGFGVEVSVPLQVADALRLADQLAHAVADQDRPGTVALKDCAAIITAQVAKMIDLLAPTS